MFRIDTSCKAAGIEQGTILFDTKASALAVIDINLSYGKNDIDSPWDYTFNIVEIEEYGIEDYQEIPEDITW